MSELIFLNREIIEEDELTNCIIVPLNAVAMRDVLKNEMNYIKIEDFIDYGFCEQNKEKIWKTFQQFLDKADEIVSEIYGNVKIKNYGPFNAFAKGIRQTIEHIAHNWIIFSKIIVNVRPSEIKLLSRKVNYGSSELITARGLDTLYKIILESIAAKNDIGFIFQSLEEKQDKSIKIRYRRNIILQTIINIIKKSKLYYNLKIGIHESKVDKINKKALFLQHDWGVYYYSQLFTHIINDSTIESYVTKNEFNESCESYKEIPCAEFIDKLHDEIIELNKLIGFDVKLIVEATLERYIKNVPLVILRALRSEGYLSKLNPRFVFFTNLHENMLPFQMALNWNNNIIKVIKEHGESIMDLTIWRNTELKPTNIYISEYKEMAEYFQKSADMANIQVRCEYDGVRLNKYYRKTKAKKKLVYVPSLFDHCMFFGISYMPQALFYRVQRHILRVLNEQKDIDDVVYKCSPISQHNYHFPVQGYIKNNLKNIRISSKPLSEELSDAMFCLLDLPSSSMFEAINMNVPCQTLIWNKIHLRLTAADYYDKFVTCYDSDLDVSEKLLSILQTKRFHTIDPQERKRMKRSICDLRDILINEMSR
jgi:hypothetical protein